MNTPTLVTTSELARRWRVAARWIRQEADQGRLPGVRAGAQWLFNLEVVEHLLAERAATTASIASSQSPGESVP